MNKLERILEVIGQILVEHSMRKLTSSEAIVQIYMEIKDITIGDLGEK